MDEYYPFEAGFGSTANSQRWRQLFGNVLPDGVVYGFLNQLAPVYNSGAGTVTIDTGALIIDGMWGALSTLQTIAVSGNGTVVASLNLSTKVASILWSAGEIEYPYTRNSTTYEVPLFSVVGGVGTDMRPFINQGATTAASVTSTGIGYSMAATTTTNYGILLAHVTEPGFYLIEGHASLVLAVDASVQQTINAKLFANQGAFTAAPPTQLGPLEPLSWPGGATGGNPINASVSSRWLFNVSAAGLWIFGWQFVVGSGATTSTIQTLGVKVSPSQAAIPFTSTTVVH